MFLHKRHPSPQHLICNLQRALTTIIRSSSLYPIKCSFSQQTNHIPFISPFFSVLMKNTIIAGRHKSKSTIKFSISTQKHCTISHIFRSIHSVLHQHPHNPLPPIVSIFLSQKYIFVII